MTEPRFLDAGECALVVEFGDRIADDLIARVQALDAALTTANPAGVVECVPTYRSLMVHYDPFVLERDALVATVRGLLGQDPSISTPGAVWSLPACYDPDLAEDLAYIAQTTGLSPETVVRTHAQATYRIAMYGFAPGWAYLSGLPESLALPRRATPRARIAAGSLIIAGGQAIVAGNAMPSGWHILGRTPERLFHPEGGGPAFHLKVGDRLTFDPVDCSAFAALSARADAGERLARRVGGTA
jgi:inhibitor of KinA